MRHVHCASKGSSQLISVADRGEAKRLYLMQLPAYRIKSGLHSLDSDIETRHSSFIDPAGAAVALYMLQVVSSITQGYFRSHACELELDCGRVKHIVKVIAFFFDSCPVSGIRGADSMLITSIQHVGWTGHTAGSPRTLMPTLISAGNDGDADNDRLIRLEFKKLRVGITGFKAETVIDNFERTNVVDFSEARIIVEW